MAVAILIGIAIWDGLAPRSTTLKVDVVDVCASIDDIDVDALASVRGIEVLVECAEAEAVAVGYAGKTPRGVLLKGSVL